MGSPGVYVRELDRSLYAPAAAPTSVGMVCTATKGPVGVRTLVTDEESFIESFGRPDPNSQGFYAARQYLREANTLWVVRVGSDDVPDALAVGTLDILDVATDPSVQVDTIDNGTFSDMWKIYVTAGTTTGFKIQLYETYGAAEEEFLEEWDNLERLTCAGIVNDPDTGSERIFLTAVGLLEPDTAQDPILFTGGANGFAGSNIDSKVVAGILLFEDSELVAIDTLMAPGFTAQAVVLTLITTSETRKDSVSLIDPPTGLGAAAVVDWHNGGGGSTLNSSYAALYWPEQIVFDEMNNQEVIVAPSGFAAAAFARTDRDTAQWWAPAGDPRGKVNSIRTTDAPTLGERDLMYGAGNNVNPIADLSGIGITIWGQKTLQRAPTALDRLNVRRMVNMIKGIIKDVSKPFIMDQNDSFTWSQWKAVVEPPLRDIKAQRGLRDFLVVMDGTTNTESLQEQSIMKGKIFLMPQKVAEVIQIDFTITSQGADFNELLIAG